MPKTKMVDEDEYRLPDDVLFPARLDKVTEKTIHFTYKTDSAAVRSGRAFVGDPGEFTKWVWEFVITDGLYADERAYGETDDRLTSREDNQVRQWGEALIGREIELGEDFDTDLLVGLPCMIQVRHDEPKPRRDGNGMFYGCSVAEVLPAGDTDLPF